MLCRYDTVIYHVRVSLELPDVLCVSCLTLLTHPAQGISQTPSGHKMQGGGQWKMPDVIPCKCMHVVDQWPPVTDCPQIPRSDNRVSIPDAPSSLRTLD